MVMIDETDMENMAEFLRENGYDVSSKKTKYVKSAKTPKTSKTTKTAKTETPKEEITYKINGDKFYIYGCFSVKTSKYDKDSLIGFSRLNVNVPDSVYKALNAFNKQK